MSKYCANCGEQVSPNQNFCNNCGEKILVREIENDEIDSKPLENHIDLNEIGKFESVKQALSSSQTGKLILKYAIIGLVMGFFILVTERSMIGVVFMFLLPIYINMLCWGWKALDRITPNMFLILPIIGWLIYFMIKAGLAMIVGWVAFPRAIYRVVKNID